MVERAISEGLINLERDVADFVTYVTEFWNFDDLDYLRRRNQESPNSIGKDYAMNKLCSFKRHAGPLYQLI